MKASSAVGLVLASSMSIFGLHACHGNSAYASVEPVWVNGVMGVYWPGTQIFVPSTSPQFNQACDLIQQQRNGYWSSGSHHSWYYSPMNHFFYTGNSGGASGMRSSSGFSSFGGSSSHFGSTRGGFGSTGHAHGGGGHS